MHDMKPQSLRSLALFSLCASLAACTAETDAQAASDTPAKDPASVHETREEPATPTTAPTTAAAPATEADPEPVPDRAPITAGEYVAFPAAGLKVRRPEGFDDAADFHGFMQRESMASVMVMHVPGPFSEVSGGFSDEARLAQQGVQLLQNESLTVEGRSAALTHLSQSAAGIEVKKWVLTFGNEEETMMVMATFPASEEKRLSAPLKEIVLATKLDDAPLLAPGEGLGFTLADSELLQPSRGLGGAKMLTLTKDGETQSGPPEDPLLIVGRSFSTAPKSERREYAVGRLFYTAGTGVENILSTEEITIDGLEGFEVVADGIDTETGIALRVYHVMLFDEGSYILIQGLVGADRSDRYLPEFKRLARSFTRE